MRMRIFLIIILILNVLGFIGAIVVRSSIHNQQIQNYEIAIWICLLILSSICAYYLYQKTPENKINWALFGFIGNLNAIMFYYCKKYVTNKWSKGKSIFRD